LFGTYRAQPANGHDRMVIGISRYHDPNYLTLVRLGASVCSARNPSQAYKREIVRVVISGDPITIRS